MAEVFDPACQRPSWRLCPQFVEPDPLDGLILSGHAAVLDYDLVAFYEHSDDEISRTLEKQGTDLVFRVR